MKKPLASTMSFYNDDDATYNVEEHFEEDRVDSNESHFIQKEPSISQETDVPRHILEARKKVYQPTISIKKPFKGNMFEKKDKYSNNEFSHYDFEDCSKTTNSYDDLYEEDDRFFFQMNDDKETSSQEKSMKPPGWDSEDRLGW